MLYRFNYIIQLFIFWLIYFFITRICFVIYHYRKIIETDPGGILQSFFSGLKLDISIISYLVLLPFILWIVRNFYTNNFLDKIALYYHYVLIVVLSLLGTANIRIYGDWGTLLNYRALSYLTHPKEVAASLNFMETTAFMVLSAFICLMGIVLFRKLTGKKITLSTLKLPLKFSLICIVPLALFIGLRGGMQTIPINESAAYFSKFQIHNHIATNNIWYLVNNTIKSLESKENSYVYFEDAKAKSIVSELYKTGNDSAFSILKTSTPNVVFIILESYTADIIASLGGESAITPNFENLVKEGVLFTDIYSSGFRTDQGIVAILSGFPSQPNNSIIHNPGKVEKLPNICDHFIKNDYRTSFYYGGEIGFANMNLYLINSGFDKIISVNDFTSNEEKGKWGVQDEHVLDKQLKNLNKETSPFFSVLLTLSTHEPFEVPMETPYNGNDEADKFRKAAYYTDRCLGKYFSEAKKEKWYDNTLFVLVADHGHRLPAHNDTHNPAGRKIPLLFYGGAIKDEFKGTRINKTGNHHDIPATLLYQLNTSTKNYKWSKNLLNPYTNDFAYIATESGFGWIKPQQDFVYHHEVNKITTFNPKKEEVLNDSLLNEGKAYLQCLYNEFLSY